MAPSFVSSLFFHQMASLKNSSPTASAAPSRQRSIHLALQGGGAHGAFTWGVLDCLLDQEDLTIGRVSGTSAGALNGAALVSGLHQGGPQQAKLNLARLWEGVARVGAPLSVFLLPLRKPGMGVWDDAMPLLSPYQTNPFALTPLRAVLDPVTDFGLLSKSGHPALFVNAVNVHNGRTRVFGPGDISMEAVLASACAPLMFQAPVIDGEPYWDGSYGANPTLQPLYGTDLDVDILMVELTPLVRAETPTTAKNILNRINEIASLNGLVAELQAIAAINRHAAKDAVRLHVVSMADDEDAVMEPSVKRTVALELFQMLRGRGYAAALQWVTKHARHLGIQSSVNIEERYLKGRRPQVAV